MARHWSTFVNITDKQARALDKMAEAHDFQSGRFLLMDIASCSSSKLSSMDRLTVQGLVDKAFDRYGR